MLDFSIRYLNILKTKLEGLNLTNILDPDEFYHKQILDSINPYLQSDIFQESIKKSGVLVDVGFGGGFPILPLAKLLPNIKFIGVESKRKKVDAVRLLADELGLTNVTLVHSRIEDFLFDSPAVISFKAVGTVVDFLPLIRHSTKAISVFFYKGPSFIDQELIHLSKLEKEWNFLGSQEISVPGTQQRFLVSFKAQNVPRGTAKTLVKLTDFL
jgi:16S rRNA (guanine527-N7)-methyltransferase